MYIKEFENYIKFEKRYSVNTVSAYLNDLKQFLCFVVSDCYLDSTKEVTSKDVRNWMISLLEDNISERSIARKISSVRKYYKFLISIGKTQNNPVDNVNVPKHKKSIPHFVPQNQIENFFVDNLFADDFIGQRDKTVMELFYNTGIRVSELIELKHADVNLREKTIKVLGKRNKERIIPVNDYMNNILKSYIDTKVKNAYSFNQESCLFISKKNKKTYRKAIYLLVKKYLSEISTLKKCSPHVLRHTFATHMLNNGADLNAIKELLGHANLAATQVYTHNSFEKLKQVYNQAHPRA